MAANVFGLDADAIARRLGLSVSARTYPSSAQITDEINAQAQYMRDIAKQRGVTSDNLTSTSDGYGAFRVWLADLVCAAIANGLNRGDDARGYAAAAERSRTQLLTQPSSATSSTSDASVTTAITATVPGLMGQVLRGGL